MIKVLYESIPKDLSIYLRKKSKDFNQKLIRNDEIRFLLNILTNFQKSNTDEILKKVWHGRSKVLTDTL